MNLKNKYTYLALIASILCLLIYGASLKSGYSRFEIVHAKTSDFFGVVFLIDKSSGKVWRFEAGNSQSWVPTRRFSSLHEYEKENKKSNRFSDLGAVPVN